MGADHWDEVQALRRQHATYLFICGLPIAAFLSVPVLNLLTPLFATALMVQIHARLGQRPAARATPRT